MQNTCDQIQMKFYQSGDDAAKILPVSFTEWEEKARQILAAGPFGYIYGAAGAGDTLDANLKAFKQWYLRPRVCTDISKRDLSINLFDTKIPFPFLLAPIGVNSILHNDAELAPAKAAAQLGIPYVLSNVSTKSMEEVAQVMGNSIRWFQLYPPKDEELTKSFLNRAKASGYSAIVVTVDSTLLGWREHDLRNGYLPFLQGHGMGNYFSDPVFRDKLDEPPEKNSKEAILRALSEGNNTCFTWQQLEFIKKNTNLPILLKGITHPSDALLAIEHGVDGIIVSNHGGRQLDGAIATLDALPMIMDCVEDKVPVLLDSGIRRGADVIKAIALGAKAVLIGRPYAYGLAVCGEMGVKEVLEKFIAETELQLGISGVKSISEVNEKMVIKL